MFSIRRQLEIEWGQCDPAGIVYYPQFLSMFDWSSMKLLQKALGMDKHQMLAKFNCGGVPVVKIETTFRAPCRFGEVVGITSTMLKVGRTSFHIQHHLHKGDELCVECDQVRVWVTPNSDDPLKIRPMPIPSEVVDRLNKAANGIFSN
jgi:4-hydroxybenzoyl-CoA thioesterase